MCCYQSDTRPIQGQYCWSWNCWPLRLLPPSITFCVDSDEPFLLPDWCRELRSFRPSSSQPPRDPSAISHQCYSSQLASCWLAISLSCSFSAVCKCCRAAAPVCSFLLVPKMQKLSAGPSQKYGSHPDDIDTIMIMTLVLMPLIFALIHPALCFSLWGQQSKYFNELRI